jgi:hypothetical protein
MVGVAESRASRTGERFFSDPLVINVRASAKGLVSTVSRGKMGFVFFIFCDIQKKYGKGSGV